jgi:hypothetical protein
MHACIQSVRFLFTMGYEIKAAGRVCPGVGNVEAGEIKARWGGVCGGVQ